MENTQPLKEPNAVSENNDSLRQNRNNKAPVYTSDKRAKFTQKANKKWVRLATVLGYIVSVSTPAVVLSIYYIFFWDPRYLEKFPANMTRARSAAYSGGSLHPGPATPSFTLPATKVKRELVEQVPPMCRCDCDKKAEPAPPEREEPPLPIHRNGPPPMRHHDRGNLLLDRAHLLKPVSSPHDHLPLCQPQNHLQTK